jgi:hypothetical protein
VRHPHQRLVGAHLLQLLLLLATRRLQKERCWGWECSLLLLLDCWWHLGPTGLEIT